MGTWKITSAPAKGEGEDMIFVMNKNDIWSIRHAKQRCLISRESVQKYSKSSVTVELVPNSPVETESGNLKWDANVSDGTLTMSAEPIKGDLVGERLDSGLSETLENCPFFLD